MKRDRIRDIYVGDNNYGFLLLTAFGTSKGLKDVRFDVTPSIQGVLSRRSMELFRVI